MSLDAVGTNTQTLPGYFAEGTVSGQVSGLVFPILARKGGEAVLDYLSGTKVGVAEPTTLTEGVAKAAVGAGIGYMAVAAAAGPYGMAATGAISVLSPFAIAATGYVVKTILH